ncbi:hypothetical protein CCYA_CCYA04G1356 [Cyanidiococcus yangmingshanensis]|nr:hypothetical protein CCYA_CCYA04G1356 [Cyanidiococcus yangmingshanensis]
MLKSYWTSVWSQLRSWWTRAPCAVEQPPPQCKDFLHWENLSSYEKAYIANFRLSVLKNLVRMGRRGEIEDPQVLAEVAALWKEVVAHQRRLRSK